MEQQQHKFRTLQILCRFYANQNVAYVWSGNVRSLRKKPDLTSVGKLQNVIFIDNTQN
jgi:hypothetical protein